MTEFEKYIQYRSLANAFSHKGTDLFTHISDEQEASIYKANGIDMKFINIPFPQPVMDELDSVIRQLNMTKRAFVQRAVLDAMERANAEINKQLDEVGVFDLWRERDEANKNKEVE